MIRNLDLRLASVRAAKAPPKPPAPAPADPASSFKTVMQEQTKQSTVAAPAAPSIPSLRSVTALPNGGLMLNPTGNNALTGGVIPYNPNYYATHAAAQQLAAQLGGTVVDLGAHISNNQPEYYIGLPNGITINAGNLLAVMNNAVYQENSRVMDGKIAELLNNNAVGTPGAGIGLYTVRDGQATFDPNGRPTVYAT